MEANWLSQLRPGRRKPLPGRRRLIAEPLERRIVLAVECSIQPCTTVEMLPEFDQFGAQIETVQAFQIENDVVVQAGGAATSQWTNVQFTWDQATERVRIYQDGAEIQYVAGYDSSVSLWDVAANTVNRQIYLGVDQEGFSGNLAGMLDDVAWFNGVLSPDQLSAVRTMGVAAAQASLGSALNTVSAGGSLVAHWDLDQATGTTALGDSGTSINLRLGSGGQAPTFRPGQGRFGGALQFDGQDDNAWFQDAAFNVGARGTLSFWVKLDDPQRSQPFVDMSDLDGLDFRYQPTNGGQLAAAVNQFADDPLTMYAIYDTGASVVTVSLNDLLLFELGLGVTIPPKVVGGAAADAIGGSLVGDVSVPGTVLADGIHAMTINDQLEVEIDFSQAARAPGVQLFLGTEDDAQGQGSPALPTITGTPIHSPSVAHPSGVAARIDMTAYQLNLGDLFPEFEELRGVVIEMPDLTFVEPGTKLPPETGSVTPPVRVPMALWGVDNHLDPGDQITAVPNPVQENVRLQLGQQYVADQQFLFDTGAQLSIISTDIALGLGLNLSQPQVTVDVQGADGNPLTVPGYTLDSLEMPYDNDGDGGVDGVLQLVDVPVYVLDLIEGLDGILGMNLFNSAQSLLYDPFDPAGASVQMSFRTDYVPEDLGELESALLEALGDAIPALDGGLPGQNLPNFGIDFGAIEGRLMQPSPAQVTNQDPGYVDVQWASSDSISLGIYAPSIDTGDILIYSDGLLTVDRVESLGNNVWRYHYGDDGETLRDGEIRVTFRAGEVTDVLGTLNTEAVVTFTYDGTAPTVTAVQLNAGQPDPTDRPSGQQPTDWLRQRSQLRDITLTFSEPIVVGQANVELVNLGINASSDEDLAINLRPDQIAIDQDRLKISLDAGQLSDGVYRLRVTGGVEDAAGNLLDGDGDGIAGDEFLHVGSATNGFFQLTADFNGDAGVSIFDFTTFAYWFGTSVPTAPQYVDLDGDLGISIFDFPIYAEAFGRQLAFAVAAQAPGPNLLHVAAPSAAARQIPNADAADQIVAQRQLERIVAAIGGGRTFRQQVSNDFAKDRSQAESDAAAIDQIMGWEQDWGLL